MAVAGTLMVPATLQAQTYNDSVRCKTWSVYVQGGLSGYHGARGTSFNKARTPLSPDFSLGVKYNVTPWARFGVNAGYTMVKSNSKAAVTETIVQPNFKVGNYTTDLEITKVRLQDRNDIHFAGIDANIDFNILGMFANRKCQKWNLYLGAGVGYMHGWTRHGETVAVQEEAVAKGDGYFNVYNKQYIEGYHTNGSVNVLYIPLSLSLEYDITPRWSLGLIGQYKNIPADQQNTPQGIYSGGLVLRYTWPHMKTNKQLYYETLADLKNAQQENEMLNGQLNAARQENDAKARQLNDLKNANGQLARDLDDCNKNKMSDDHTVYFLVADHKLSQQEKLRLDEYAEYLKSKGNAGLTIIGEASAEGNTVANQKLSERRLQTVVEYLRTKGITDTYIKREQAIGDSEKGYDPKYRRVKLIMAK